MPKGRARILLDTSFRFVLPLPFLFLAPPLSLSFSLSVSFSLPLASSGLLLLERSLASHQTASPPPRYAP